MKILKKIGIGCIALVICFCSCFKPIHAYQDNFILGENGPNYQSAIGSIEFGVGSVFGDTSVNNQSIPLSTSFYFAEPPKQYDALVSIVNDYGIETNFSYDQMLDRHLIDQKIYFNHSGLIDFSINFLDVYIDTSQPLDIPSLLINTNSINIEQAFYATYSCDYFNTSTLDLKRFEETQPIELIKTEFNNSELYTLDLRTLFHNIVSADLLDNRYGHIYRLTLNIQSLDVLSNSNTLEIGLNQMVVSPSHHTLLSSIFDTKMLTEVIVDPNEVSFFDWIINSIDSFMSAEIFPNFSIGTLLGTVVAIPLLIYILRLFMGG